MTKDLVSKRGADMPKVLVTKSRERDTAQKEFWQCYSSIKTNQQSFWKVVLLMV